MEAIRREIIFGLIQEKAQEKLKDFLSNNLLIYETVVDMADNYIFTGLRLIHAVGGNIPTKGIRCEITHVDKDISIRYLQECIEPIVLNKFGEIGYIKYY